MGKKQILVGTISGGHIVGQISGIELLSLYGYKPDVYMGASGGAITCSIYISSGNTKPGIERIVKQISSEQFVEEWVMSYLSSLIGFFQGSLYKHPTNYRDITKMNISVDILRNTEFWIQTYSITDLGTVLFCTKKEGDTILYTDERTKRSANILDTIYIDGDVELYATALKASSSIPTILPPIEVFDKELIDGGIDFSSPLIPLKASIRELEEFDIIYITGYTLDESIMAETKRTTIFDTFSNTLELFLRSHITQDRLVGCNLVSADDKYIEEDITLEDYFKRRETWKRSFLEICPTVTRYVDITKCTPGSIYKEYKEQLENNELMFRIRYINYPDPDI
jgi:predicted acylesterase/phospholipase RssA